MTNMEQKIKELEYKLQQLEFRMNKKLGAGSADVIINAISPSSVPGITIGANEITQAMLQDTIVGKNELRYEQVAVTVLAGASTGTGTCTSGSVIIGWRATGNQDQLVDNIAVSGTTVTITTAANATINNTFEVTLIKS